MICVDVIGGFGDWPSGLSPFIARAWRKATNKNAKRIIQHDCRWVLLAAFSPLFCHKGSFRFPYCTQERDREIE